MAEFDAAIQIQNDDRGSAISVKGGRKLPGLHRKISEGAH
jgi:hypothetical protein